MIRYAHIHNAWVICTQDEFSEKTDVRVLVPVGHKGYPGFEIRDAKINGNVCWGHGDKRTTDKEMLNNIINELKKLEISLDQEEKNNEPVTKKREGGLAKCEDCGVTLIAPYDGQPYYCQECSQIRDRDP
jgi:hypothetical protein